MLDGEGRRLELRLPRPMSCRRAGEFGLREGIGMRVVGVFAKYWSAGGVKTRLAAELGTAAATEFYRRMLAAVLQRVRGAVVDEGAAAVIAFAPAAAEPAFAAAAPQWELQPQVDGDLGQRLATFFQQQFDRGATRVVVVGSDCLDVDADVIASAWSLLDVVPIVWGPASDGGYYLVGLSQPVPALFQDIPWSTDQVLRQSQARAATAGLTQGLLPPLEDIDDDASLRRWCARHRDANDESLRQLAAWAERLSRHGPAVGPRDAAGATSPVNENLGGKHARVASARGGNPSENSPR
jgi:rSAM/selenodomain-associated transferase 1